MANIKSAIKSIRKDAKRTERNRPVRSSLKTYVKNAVTAVSSNDQEASLEQIRIAISKLDKAAGKGIIHKNQAARRKARLMQRFNKKFTPAQSE